MFNSVDGKGTGFIINLKVTGARNTALAHSAGNNSSVRGHAATGGEDTFGYIHPLEVFRRRLDTHQHHFMSFFHPFLGFISMEHNLTGCSAGRSGKAFSQNPGFLHGGGIKYGVQQFVELGRFAAEQGFLLGKDALFQHVHGDFHHGSTGTLSVTGLQHPQFAILNGKLEVLHIAVVIFKFLLDLDQFLVDGRHCLLK